MLTLSEALASLRFLLPIVALLLAFEAPAQPAADVEGLKFRIVIDAPLALRNTLKNGLDLARWESYGNMTAELLEPLLAEAREQAREAAATEGYFSPKVDISVEGEQREQRVVHIKIDPGVPTHVKDVVISIRGDVDDATAARIREQWTLPANQVFQQAAWDAAKKNAVGTLARTRFLGASVRHSQATIDPEAHTASLEVDLETGPAYSFGPIAVRGLSRYSADKVTNLAPFKPGEPYSREEIEVFLRRLNTTNYFASAQVVVDPDPANASAAPVTVSLIEAPSRRLETGIGYSTDTLFNGSINWRDVDLFDSGWRLRSELRLESKVQRLGGSIELPTRSDGWTDSMEAQAERTDIENLVTRGVTVGATRRSIDERRQPAFGASYYYEHQFPADFPPDLARALFARYEYVVRTVDDLLLPRSGAIAALRLGVSVPGASTRSFGRGVAQVLWFHSLGRREDLTLRAEAGAVLANSSEGIPQALLFRTGGDTTIRGYAYQSLGVQRGSAIVGGRYYALGSAEYIHWFAETWGAAAFLDAGNAVDQLASFKAVLGYGVGLRVKSPIGPFRLDVARGQETGKFRLHFSAGVAF